MYNKDELKIMRALEKMSGQSSDDAEQHKQGPFEWFVRHERLVASLCRKSTLRADCNKSISFDDLMAHCLDKMPGIFERYTVGVGKLGLRGWVVMNLMYYIGNYIKRRNRDDGRRDANFPLNTVLSEELYTGDSLAHACRVSLENKLNSYECKLLFDHDMHEKTFGQIAKEVGLSRATVQRDYLQTLYKARRLMKGYWQ